MALIKCKECGSEVSNKAKTCPKCGISNPGIPAIAFATENQWKIIKGTFIAFLWLLLFGTIFGAIFSDNNSSSSSYSSSSSSNSSASGMTLRECEDQRTEFYGNCGDGIFNPIKCSDRLKCWKQGNHWRMSKNGADFL